MTDLAGLDNGHQPSVTRTRPRHATPSRDHLPNPAAPGTPTCAARQVLGTRVCDLPPHPTHIGHVGAGPADPRGEFWGQR